ncbi:hypothetical protein [Alkalihalobacterium alkalinitrilicum]|uniref:hypothetical protein n=1 Tax=Alkalihalobacterium alkalinitrilicum TaxID=427920 RepID=UPI0009955678|nr:hypothetical protein [Alkalihalobacterium alkalinitrilicum]
MNSFYFEKNHKSKSHCKKTPHAKKKDDKTLFTDFDKDQNTSRTIPAVNCPTPANPIAKVEICTDEKKDKVLLHATVEWKVPELLSISACFSDLGSTSTGLFGVPVTFRIWRICDDETPQIIFETTDTSSPSTATLTSCPKDEWEDAATCSPGFQVTTLSLTPGASTTTTHFHWVDQNPCCGLNRYYLTVDLGPIPKDICDPQVPIKVDSRVFTAAKFSDVC